jgi:putative SOS response-associated peptidase YedK
MCGRIAQSFEADELYEFVNFKNVFSAIKKRYNIAPSENVAVIKLGNDSGIELVELKWGFIPSWATKEKNIRSQINARSEGIESKPFFRGAFKKNRCLIPVSGFYEWKKVGDNKQPYFIRSVSKTPLFLAGVYDLDKETSTENFAIITTEPNQAILEVHNRMPAIISNKDIKTWLFEDSKVAKELLKPWQEDLEIYRVSTAVNSARNDSPELVIKI